MSAKHRCFPFLAAVVTLFCAGCDVVVFEHPLSDEKTSKVDERLLGDWRIEDDTTNGYARVARLADSKNVLEVSSVGGQPGREEKPSRIYTTEIQGRHYASVKLEAFTSEEEKKEERPGWYLSRYEFTDPDTVRFFFPDCDFVAATIARGDLCGTVSVTRNKYSGEIPIPFPILNLLWRLWGGKTPTITTTTREKECRVTEQPAVVARYLRDHGLECFPEEKDKEQDSSLVFVRHKEEKPSLPAKTEAPPGEESSTHQEEPAAETPSQGAAP